MYHLSRCLSDDDDLQQASSLDTNRVLVDCDGHFVLQDGPGAVVQVSKVIGHDERSSHYGPQSHLRVSLVHTETKVSNDELRRNIRGKKMGCLQ